MKPLDLETLRKANIERCLKWNGPKGVYAESLRDWALAMIGEAREVCNVVKKIGRAESGKVGNDVSYGKLKEKLADELADVVIYCDLLASRASINLSVAIAKKFNDVSRRNGFLDRIYLDEEVKVIAVDSAEDFIVFEDGYKGLREDLDEQDFDGRHGKDRVVRFDTPEWRRIGKELNYD